MKRVIDGRTYDTDTAIYVAGGDNFDWSNAWWGLYKAPHGVFFKVAVDHDGSTVREFEPLSDDEARAVLAKHAREPVEQYFGSMSNIGDSMGHVSMRLPRSLVDRLEAAAAARGLSLDNYAIRCLTRCVASDGHLVA